MKKNILVLVLLVVLLAWLPLFLGAVSHWAEDGSQIKPTYSASPNSSWTALGTITASQAALAVTARDYSAVDDLSATKTVEWDIPAEADNVELRFQTDADSDDHVLNVYLARGAAYTDGSTEDSYTLALVLTLEGGTQTGPNSNVFCDTVTETQDYGGLGAIVDAATGDRIGRYVITKLRGYKKMVIIATTYKSSTTIYIDGAWYSNED